MSKLQPVRGTHDLFLEEAEKFRHIVKSAAELSKLYCFGEIQTPIFEFTEVFKRTLGETSDVVNKEMYTFEDRGNESLTLRPEFTAGIARAFISNGLAQHLPLKFFSSGPLFRYERPQKGRQRQFHQVNFEWLGEKEPYADVELIMLAKSLLEKIEIKNFKLHINSLGDKESRENYRNKLVEYFSQFKDKLSEDSKLRLEKNPLRILDSKNEGDKEIVKNAPKIFDSFTKEAKEFFDKVKSGLTALNIEFIENPKIVRGLDYYNHTVFEFISEAEEMGAQNTILAGGRYDNLIKTMGGPETPAVGFAAGIERLMLSIPQPKNEGELVAIMPLGDAATEAAMVFALWQRHKLNKPAQVIFGGNLKKKLHKADAMKATQAIIIGDNEIKEGIYILKDMKTGKEEKLKFEM